MENQRRKPDFNVFLKNKENRSDKFTLLGLWQREVDWISGSFRKEVVEIILRNEDGSLRRIKPSEYFVTLYDNREKPVENQQQPQGDQQAQQSSQVPPVAPPPSDGIPF